MTELPEVSPRAAGAALVVVAAFWSLAALYALMPALPHSPISLPLADRMRPAVVAPEGWAFFTRSPREPRPTIFLRAAGGWREAGRGQNALPRYAFGLDRTARGEGAEVGLLLERVRGAWKPCTAPDEACLNAAAPAARVRNLLAHPRLCGTVGVVTRPPVPWAWARAQDDVRMPGSVIVLEAAC